MREGNWRWNSGLRCYECCDCNYREFASRPALFQHLRNSCNHNWCEDCNLEFDYQPQLFDHYIESPNHHYCNFCNSHWDDEYDLSGHQITCHSLCGGCHEWFEDEWDLEQHAGWYCRTHKRCFRNENNLRMHMLSAAHAQNSVFCPAGCGRSFISYSAAAIHLESGSCPSGLNREKINHHITQWDRQGLITTQRRALPAPPSYNSSTSSHQKFEATEASYSHQNGAYKCPFDNRLFGTLRALNQHLGSAKHTYTTRTNAGGDKLYRCPRRNDCEKEFLTLSGLLQHVEQGNCGVRKMQGVTDTIDRVMGGMRSLTL